MPPKQNNQIGIQDGESTEHCIATSGTWKHCWIDLVIDVAIVDWVNVDSSVKHNTNIVDVVGGIEDTTIIKKNHRIRYTHPQRRARNHP